MGQTKLLIQIFLRFAAPEKWWFGGIQKIENLFLTKIGLAFTLKSRPMTPYRVPLKFWENPQILVKYSPNFWNTRKFSHEFRKNIIFCTKLSNSFHQGVPFLHQFFYTNFFTPFFCFFTPFFLLLFLHHFLHQFFASFFSKNLFLDFKIWCKKSKIFDVKKNWCKKSKNFGVKKYPQNSIHP